MAGGESVLGEGRGDLRRLLGAAAGEGKLKKMNPRALFFFLHNTGMHLGGQMETHHDVGAGRDAVFELFLHHLRRFAGDQGDGAADLQAAGANPP